MKQSQSLVLEFNFHCTSYPSEQEPRHAANQQIQMLVNYG